MNSQRLVLISLALALAALFLAFTFNSGWSDPLSTTIRAPITSAPTRDAVIPPEAPPRLTRDELRARAFSILSLPFERDRLREFCALLNSVTAENEGAIREAAEILRRREGRNSKSALLLLQAHLERLAAGRPDAPLAPAPLTSSEVVKELKTLSETKDEVEKMRRFFQLLSGIDAENWLDAIEAIDKPGPDAPLVQSRFSMLLAQIGETVGPRVLEERSVSVRFYLGEILQGWAESSPAAAVEWLSRYVDSRKAIAQYNVACGICASDPHRAWSLLTTPIEGSGARLVGSADYLVYQMTERSGIRAAEAFYNVLRQDPRTEKETLRKAFNHLSHARELMLLRGTREDGVAALNWLDAYLPRGVEPGSSFLAMAGKLAPEEARAWTERNRDRVSATDPKKN